MSAANILVFGGTFDPPHVGHAALLAAAARASRADAIIIVPALRAPLKDPPYAPWRERLQLIRLSILAALPAGIRSKARVDLSEIRSGRMVYTVDTLGKIRRRNPRARLHFAVGSDAARSFESWKNPGELRSLCEWWTASRPPRRSSESAPLPPFFKKIGEPMPSISSTRLREMLLMGEDVSRWTGRRAFLHIRARKLYGSGWIGFLQARLASRRFEHSIAVARWAAELAGLWGLPRGKALGAGLLHDLGRSMPWKDLARDAVRRRLEIPLLAETARRAPGLLHSYMSAAIAQRELGVLDPEVLDAVRRHTLGADSWEEMAPLSRLLYVADASSPDRRFRGAARLRALARKDLREAFKACAAAKIAHALSRGSWIHPQGISLWNSLIKNEENSPQ